MERVRYWAAGEMGSAVSTWPVISNNQNSVFQLTRREKKRREMETFKIRINNHLDTAQIYFSEGNLKLKSRYQKYFGIKFLKTLK